MTQPRVLIADLERVRLQKYLEERGFVCVSTTNGDEIMPLILQFQPDLVLIDHLLAGKNALQILRELRQINRLGDGPNQCQVIVISAHSSSNNVRDCLEQGAIDYVVKPFNFNDVVTRLAFHSQKRRELREMEKTKDALHEGHFYIYLTELVLRQALNEDDLETKLFKLTQMTSLTLKAVRCSIIKCDTENNTGTVICSQDDSSATGIQLDLNKYPEITTLMSTEKIIVLENLEQNAVMKEIKKYVQSISFNSMVVAPIKIRKQLYGALSIRMPKSRSTVDDIEVRFAQVMAHIAGMLISMNDEPS